jgi:anti-sigma B factor antagonist
MNFSKSIEGDTIILRIEGELDAMTALELRPALDELSEQKPKKVKIDLSALRLIDSSGVGAIVSLFKRLRATGGEVSVEGVTGQPRAIFEVLRLDKVFSIS